MDQAVNTEHSPLKQEGGFFYFIKKFLYVILFILFFVAIFIILIKFGSNFFLEVMRKINSKDEYKEEGEVERVKRSVEDRVTNIKNREKLIIDLNLLDEINTVEALEERLYNTELELKTLKDNVLPSGVNKVETPKEVIVDAPVESPKEVIMDAPVESPKEQN